MNKTDTLDAPGAGRREFLNALYQGSPDNLYLELCCIHPTTGEARSLWGRMGNKGELSAALKQAEILNREGFGMYFAPCLRNTKQGKSNDHWQCVSPDITVNAAGTVNNPPEVALASRLRDYGLNSAAWEDGLNAFRAIVAVFPKVLASVLIAFALLPVLQRFFPAAAPRPAGHLAVASRRLWHEKPCRGLILSTGETTIEGEMSVVARMLVLEIPPWEKRDSGGQALVQVEAPETGSRQPVKVTA